MNVNPQQPLEATGRSFPENEEQETEVLVTMPMEFTSARILTDIEASCQLEQAKFHHENYLGLLSNKNVNIYKPDVNYSIQETSSRCEAHLKREQLGQFRRIIYLLREDEITCDDFIYALNLATFDLGIIYFNNKTLLSCLTMPEHFSVAKYLIENQKVDINQQNLDGSSALHCAAYNKNIELCRLLIDHNANKEAGDSEGSTPLMYAVMANQPSIVFKLLNKGCNQLTKRYDGLDAIALSKKLKYKICTAKMMGHLKKYPKS